MTLDYHWLYDTVRQRFASDDAFEAFLPKTLTREQLAHKRDGRYLSAMTQRVFQAGMLHSVVDAKWPAFEEVFQGFEPRMMAALRPTDIDVLMTDARIIRHRIKLDSIARNAKFILEMQDEHGFSFAEFIADWPVTDIIGLWRVLAKRGARLGGRSSAGFLRLAGKDTFLLTSDVVARLIAAGVVTGEPASQRDLQRVQIAFNELQQQSGRPLCQLSALLSLSINPRF